jgi:integrase
MSLQRRSNPIERLFTRWDTFRHTYCSWLDKTGAPMKVQQELMRHAS